jgi:hypothetical protein
VFRQGKCTQKELDELKMLVVEVGIDRITQSESYRLLYYYKGGEDKIPWDQMITGGHRTLESRILNRATTLKFDLCIRC